MAFPYDITTQNVIAGNLLNLITWTAPSDMPLDTFLYTHIRYRTDGFPIDENDGRAVCNVSGSGGSYFVHTNLENNVNYYYSLFSVYSDGSVPIPVITHYGPYTTGPSTPSSGSQFFNDVLITFTKLGKNTRLYSREQKFNTADLIIWLPAGQEERKPAIIEALRQIKPAHTMLRIYWEAYYVAHTTTTQFSSGSFDTDVHKVENGTIINKVPTIDSSFSGEASV